MLIIDQYAYTNRLANASATFKMIYAVAVLVTATAFYYPLLHLFLFVGSAFGIVVLAGIPLRDYFKIFRIPLFFLLTSLLTIWAVFGADDYLISIPFFSTRLGITPTSFDQGIRLLFRSLASFNALLFLGLTTSMQKIAMVLKKIHIPSLFIELFVLTYRFIFIFLEEMIELRDAQSMRFGYINRKTWIHSTALLIRALFTRLLNRYEEMSRTLEIRLYNGDFQIGE